MQVLRQMIPQFQHLILLDDGFVQDSIGLVIQDTLFEEFKNSLIRLRNIVSNEQSTGSVTADQPQIFSNLQYHIFMYFIVQVVFLVLFGEPDQKFDLFDDIDEVDLLGTDDAADIRVDADIFSIYVQSFEFYFPQTLEILVFFQVFEVDALEGFGQLLVIALENTLQYLDGVHIEFRFVVILVILALTVLLGCLGDFQDLWGVNSLSGGIDGVALMFDHVDQIEECHVAGYSEHFFLQIGQPIVQLFGQARHHIIFLLQRGLEEEKLKGWISIDIRLQLNRVPLEGYNLINRFHLELLSQHRRGHLGLELESNDWLKLIIPIHHLFILLMFLLALFVEGDGKPVGIEHASGDLGCHLHKLVVMLGHILLIFVGFLLELVHAEGDLGLLGGIILVIVVVCHQQPLHALDIVVLLIDLPHQLIQETITLYLFFLPHPTLFDFESLQQNPIIHPIKQPFSINQSISPAPITLAYILLANRLDQTIIIFRLVRQMIADYPLIPTQAFLYMPSEQDRVTTRDGNKIRIIFGGGATFDPKEEKLIEDLRKELGRGNKNKHLDDFPDQFLLRFLQATNFNNADCMKALKQYDEWQKKMLPLQLSKNIQQHLNNGLIYACGRDYKFRPLVVINVQKILERKMSENELLELMGFYYQYLIENFLIEGQVENWVSIIDLGFCGVFSVGGALLDIIKHLSAIFRSRAHHNYLIRCPSAIKILWRMIKGALNEDQLKKISISEKSEMKAEVFETQFKATQIEKKYGGTLPDIVQYWPLQPNPHPCYHPQEHSLITKDAYDEMFTNGLLKNRKIKKSLIKKYQGRQASQPIIQINQEDKMTEKDPLEGMMNRSLLAEEFFYPTEAVPQQPSDVGSPFSFEGLLMSTMKLSRANSKSQTTSIA